MMINSTVKRVVSLLPSATEALILAGGEHLLVGRSHECDYPKSIQHLPVLTGQKTEFTTSKDVDLQVRQYLSNGDGNSLYTLDIPVLKALQPDLILTQDLCDVCAIDIMTVERVAHSMNPQPKVISLNPQSVQDIMANVAEIGEAIGTAAVAAAAAERLAARVGAAVAAAAALRMEREEAVSLPRVLFVEWLDPPFVGGHWTPQLIDWAGGTQPLNPAPIPLSSVGSWRETVGAGKSFTVDPSQCADVNPDKIIICPCGLDVQKTEEEMRRMLQQSPEALRWLWGLGAFRRGGLALVDGNVHFNRPGPRVADALEFLVGFLNDKEDLIPQGFPWKRLTPDDFPGVRFPDAGADPDAPVAPPGAAGPAALAPTPPPPPPCEVEEAHLAACAENKPFYRDPSTGLMVMTETYIRSRGQCCGNACRHCPFGHMNVKDPSRKKNVVRRPVFIMPKKKRKDGSLKRKEEDDCIVICWSGGKDSFLALTEITEQFPSSLVCLMTSFSSSNNTVAIQGISTQDIAAQAATLGLPLCLVPLPDQCPNDEYVGAMRKGLDTIANSTGNRPTKMVFGDLHLEDIRQWRVSTFHHSPGFPEVEVVFPLWGRDPRSDLLPLLWRRLAIYGARATLSAVEVPAAPPVGGWGAGEEENRRKGGGRFLGPGEGGKENCPAGQHVSANEFLKQGMEYDADLVERIPSYIDVMGERGEFHTHVLFEGGS